MNGKWAKTTADAPPPPTPSGVVQLLEGTHTNRPNRISSLYTGAGLNVGSAVLGDRAVAAHLHTCPASRAAISKRGDVAGARGRVGLHADRLLRAADHTRAATKAVFRIDRRLDSPLRGRLLLFARGNDRRTWTTGHLTHSASSYSHRRDLRNVSTKLVDPPRRDQASPPHGMTCLTDGANENLNSFGHIHHRQLVETRTGLRCRTTNNHFLIFGSPMRFALAILTCEACAGARKTPGASCGSPHLRSESKCKRCQLRELSAGAQSGSPRRRRCRGCSPRPWPRRPAPCRDGPGDSWGGAPLSLLLSVALALCASTLVALSAGINAEIYL